MGNGNLLKGNRENRTLLCEVGEIEPSLREEREIGPSA